MTWEMIVAIVFIIFAAVAFAASRLLPEKNYKGDPNPSRIASHLAGAGSLGIAILVLLIGSYVVVSTRNVGVVTTFGKPSGTLNNGFHLKAPWQSVTEMDGSIQIDQHKDNDTEEGKHGDALVVRLGNNSNAWADTSVRWEIKLDAADDLFLQYKTFDNVRTNLITRNLQVALNEVFATYNPLASANPTAPNAPTPPPVTESKLPELAAKATKLMQDKVGDQVTIFEVQIPTIAFDGETQAKIDQLNQQRAATAVAVESLATANAQSAANKALEQSLSPEILQSKCLDVVKEKGGSVFGCLPGAGAVPTIPVPTGGN